MLELTKDQKLYIHPYQEEVLDWILSATPHFLRENKAESNTTKVGKKEVFKVF